MIPKEIDLSSGLDRRRFDWLDVGYGHNRWWIIDTVLHADCSGSHGSVSRNRDTNYPIDDFEN